MTTSQSFLPHDFSSSDRDVHFKLSKPVLATAAMGIMLTGCGAPSMEKMSDEAMEKHVEEVQINLPTPPAETTSNVPAVPMADPSEKTTIDGAMMEKTPDAAMQKYADGTYAAIGGYRAPSGEETTDISLTIKNGVVTDSTFKVTATVGKSVKFQEAFGAGYKQMVVGKSVDEISLDVVNGSSLTPKGFMDALTKIKTQASKKA